MVLPVNFSKSAQWSRGRGGSFKPNPGAPTVHGTRINPVSWRSKETYSARLFVGFNVGLTPTYTLADVIALTKEVRVRQTGIPNATFLSQEGIYTYQSGPLTGKYTQETGCQIILINTDEKITCEQFITHCIELAEIICKTMAQAEVVIEFQRNGSVLETVGVSAE